MDSFGRLLFKQGAVIQTQAHAIDMIERGMYIEEELYTKLPQYDKNRSSSGRKKQEAPDILKNEAPSVIYSINLAVKRLSVLLKNIKKFPDARANLLEIVKIIRFAVNLNENLALANIQLNHLSGAYPVRHCVDTAILAIMVAESMNKTEQEIQDIAAAAITMNISMIELQEKLQVNKGEISDTNKTAIRNHPIASIDLLYEAGIEDTDWLNYVLLHHEHEDGSGYPVGNVKSEIPQNAKILTLADGFCARISARGYRRSNLPSVALRDIFLDNKAHADPTLAAYFIKVLGLYPPGTFVQLKNSEIAVISQRATDSSPCIASALVKPNGELYVNPVKRDTSVDPYTIMEAKFPDKASVQANLQQIWGSLART
jgi:response regulator RpfG family c-di-GMP phosphodiesterase